MDTFEKIQSELEASLEDELLYSEASLSELKVVELREILQDRNLPVYGTKEVLIKRLLDSEVTEEPLAVESTINIKKEVEDDEQFQQEEPKKVEPAKGFKV